MNDVGRSEGMIQSYFVVVVCVRDRKVGLVVHDHDHGLCLGRDHGLDRRVLMDRVDVVGGHWGRRDEEVGGGVLSVHLLRLMAFVEIDFLVPSSLARPCRCLNHSELAYFPTGTYCLWNLLL